jgi:hypothetical protein
MNRQALLELRRVVLNAGPEFNLSSWCTCTLGVAAQDAWFKARGLALSFGLPLRFGFYGGPRAIVEYEHSSGHYTNTSAGAAFFDLDDETARGMFAGVGFSAGDTAERHRSIALERIDRALARDAAERRQREAATVRAIMARALGEEQCEDACEMWSAAYQSE